MITLLAMNASPLVAVAAVLTMIFLLTARKSAQARRRVHHLESAKRLMEEHLASMAEVIDDDRVPVGLKSKLLYFSDVIFDREIFLDLLMAACSDERRRGKDRNIRNDVLGDLSQIDPNLATAYDVAVTSAITSMLFRNQDAGWILDDHLARIAMDSEKRSIFLQAVQRGRNRNDPPTMPHMAAVA